MLEKIAAAVIMNLMTRLYNLVMGRIEAKQQTKKSDAGTDARVEQFKKSVNEAFDGTAVTPEQRKKINEDFADLVRGSVSRGL